MRRLFAAAVLALALAACASDAATPAPAAVRALQVYVGEPGIYRVTAADLRAAGLPVSGGALPRLQLRHRDAFVPLDVVESGDDFSLYFYARPEISIYSSTDAYRLSLGDAPGLRMSTRTVERAGSPPAPSFADTLTVAERRIYNASPIDGARWFWLSLASPLSTTISVNVPGVAAGEARVRVTLAGATEGAHHVEVRVNGALAGDAQWEGRTRFVFEAPVAAFKTGSNGVNLRAVGAVDQPEVDLLESIGVSYARAYSAADDMLSFAAQAGSMQVGGFRNGALALYDVTNPSAPSRVSGFVVAQLNGETVLSYTDTRGGRFMALATGAARKPVSLRPVSDGDLRAAGLGADYLVIAPGAFADALKPLLAYRTARGLKAQRVDIEQVYDTFSDGVPTPYAIRELVRYARAHWSPAPRFVLLVGKASYDYQNYLKGPNQNLVPTFLLPAINLGEAASDNWFVAESDEDDRPVLSIGRIPAKTPEQVRVAVDKLLAFEQAAPAEWRRRALIVADNKDASFNASADMLAGLLPPGMTTQKLYLSDAGGNVNTVRPALVRAWNDGAGLIAYVGHGSIDTWAAGPLFGVEHAGDIKNGGRLPILLTPTCLDGFFYHPQKDSLAEVMLFKPDGGMIGGLVPTGLSFPAPQDELMKGLFDELVVKAAPTIGEAVMRAKRRMAADQEQNREVIDTFVWLGDPALGNPFAAGR
ncbi:MAG: hypothetical protein HZB53_13735 [Chloroflexi bacterium]|nr:hypothetical protein [Chloroflexota bacterium]